MLRKEVAGRAAEAGYRVDLNVTKSTTILVMDDQDVTRLDGRVKNVKHRKVEARIAEGQAIKILRETDFGRLLQNAHRQDV